MEIASVIRVLVFFVTIAIKMVQGGPKLCWEFQGEKIVSGPGFYSNEGKREREREKRILCDYLRCL